MPYNKYSYRNKDVLCVVLSKDNSIENPVNMTDEVREVIFRNHRKIYVMEGEADITWAKSRGWDMLQLQVYGK